MPNRDETLAIGLGLVGIHHGIHRRLAALDAVAKWRKFHLNNKNNTENTGLTFRPIKDNTDNAILSIYVML
jgi:hypothetical protein